jgi:hypothetical protein
MEKSIINAPKGFEKNWIKTIPGEGWFALKVFLVVLIVACITSALRKDVSKASKLRAKSYA